jgi:hypothetical protein
VGAVTELGTRGWTKLLRLGLQTAHGEADWVVGWQEARRAGSVSPKVPLAVCAADMHEQRLVRSRDSPAQANDLSRKRGLVTAI